VVGATGDKVWSVNSGSLPPGMSFNATTATLSGTPTTAGNYTFTIKVASGGYSDEVEVDFEIAAPPVNYAEMIAVQGGTLPASSGLGNQTVATFQIGKYETTWEEWQTVRTYAIANGYDLTAIGNGAASTHPVQMVNWYDVVKWCNAKSQMEGLTPAYTLNGTTYKTGEVVPTVSSAANGYRLPSEKEWEWAARGGVSSRNFTYSGSNTLYEVGWTAESNYMISGTKAVGTLAGNELGIYDMSGNVWEWCEDVAYTSRRRFRGGSWNYSASSAAVAFRNYFNPVSRDGNNGFRLARNVVGAMVTVQGGTLPASSGLGNQTVATFQIGKYETTWEEWQTVRTYAIANGYDLTAVGNGTASTHPVQTVTWYDVVKWSNAKSQMEGLTPVYTVNGTTYKTGRSAPTVNSAANGYRLPSEKEWEWAARGGLSSGNYTYSGSNTVSEVAWTSVNNTPSGTKAVGTKAANELGIYDMSGNVWEWCGDVAYTSANTSYRRLRGGSWSNYAVNAAVASRGYYESPTYRLYALGFRLGRNAQ
jgi:formylglycine-generating enzyme required for sulfatase activity